MRSRINRISISKQEVNHRIALRQLRRLLLLFCYLQRLKEYIENDFSGNASGIRRTYTFTTKVPENYDLPDGSFDSPTVAMI